DASIARQGRSTSPAREASTCSRFLWARGPGRTLPRVRRRTSRQVIAQPPGAAVAPGYLLELDGDAVVDPPEDQGADEQRNGRSHARVDHVPDVRQVAVEERGAERVDRRGQEVDPADDVGEPVVLA